ncbi:MAG: calcium-binding protein [Patulibacter minatonensis]
MTLRRTLTIAALALLAAPVSASAQVIVGTPGGDRLVASPQGDTLWGGGGADTLIGGDGNDRFYGVRSDNRIQTGGGDDYVEGGAGSDVITAGDGQNTIFGGSGQDQIRTGDGNNYVDVGGGNDRATLGDGDNVLLTGSGGGHFTAGNGDNTVYYGSGIAYITLGSGVNQIYLSATSGIRHLDCGGNPATTVYINQASLGPFSMQIFLREKAKGCANITTFAGPERITAEMAPTWETFALVGSRSGRNKLFGGHGGGTISGGDGDNIIWADRLEDTGLPRSRQHTTVITAGNGANQIYGGRGTNLITAGNGNNFIRAGAWKNVITVGSGINQIRLQGAKSTNRVTIRGARADREGTYVESFANGRRPVIRCEDGATAVIVYGNTKPISDCGGPLVSARSKRGERIQVARTPGIEGSDEVVPNPIRPGQDGYGVPRPNGGR